MHNLILAVMGLLFSFSTAFGQVRLSLDDGSEVIGKCDNPIKIKTKYGVLIVDFNSIYNTELGPRLTDKEAAEFKTHLKNLDSDVFEARDKAHKAITEMGNRVYPFLVIVQVESASMEVKRRVEQIIKSLRDKYPQIDLREPQNDLFTLADIKGAGTIIDKSIKLDSALLGQIDVPLAHVLKIATRGQSNNVSVGGNQEYWLDTGVDIQGIYDLKVTGAVDMWTQTPGQYISNGTGILNVSGKDSIFFGGSLIYSVGDLPSSLSSGKMLGVGQVINGNGRLYVRVVQSVWMNPMITGEFKIKITRR